MTAAAVISAGARGALLDAIIQKSKDACFVDYIVGICLASYYAQAYFSSAWSSVELWPLVGALACTRLGDALKGMAKHISDGMAGRRANG